MIGLDVLCEFKESRVRVEAHQGEDERRIKLLFRGRLSEQKHINPIMPVCLHISSDVFMSRRAETQVNVSHC